MTTIRSFDGDKTRAEAMGELRRKLGRTPTAADIEAAAEAELDRLPMRIATGDAPRFVPASRSPGSGVVDVSPAVRVRL